MPLQVPTTMARGRGCNGVAGGMVFELGAGWFEWGTRALCNV